MKKTKLAALLLCAVMIVGIFLPTAASASGNSFSDVDSTAWYAENVQKLIQLGMLNGYPDGTFRPYDNISRSEFIKLAAIASEIPNTTPLTTTYWAEEYWRILNDAGILEMITADASGAQYSEPIFHLNAAELEKPITRNEMAFIINGVLYMAYFENQMQLKDSGDSYANHIADYNSIDMTYRACVEQVYSKGILTGKDDTSFCGEDNLTRAEACTVLVRLLWGKTERVTQSYASVKEAVEVDPSFTSFAFQYRTMSVDQRRAALFGTANKSYFSSAADAGSNIVNITVKTWDINSSGGKYTRTWNLQVHRLVAKEVQCIFDDIYNSPEQFPIHSMGGARYSDTLRHSWGCAIDINPVENYYVSFRTGQQVGTCCWQNVAQFPNVDSRYCITPNSSVVKAFAKYGWGWGGQGWTSGVDYMHFSILASGG